MPGPSLRHVLDEMAAHARAIRVHEPGARAGRDPGALHDMRVAVRRLRAILRAGRDLFDAKAVERLRGELDWLGGKLGLVRDLDVLDAYLRPRLAALEGPEYEAGQRVLRHLAADRARARVALNEALDGPRYPRVLAHLEGFVAQPPASAPDVSLPDVAATEGRRLRKAVQKLPGRPSMDELHSVRIKVKRARYAAELARAVAGARGQRFIDQAKKLQDILGDLQDAVVIEQYLHDAIDRTEPAQALRDDLVRRQRKRRTKARAAFFEEWPKLERRGRKAWIG
ncbi:MAG TPA: CHAD domain-containing protein [Methylomirabilota bacterium]|nr:CHAD domain-containing protein [Methylomirabilota bacterium]